LATAVLGGDLFGSERDVDGGGPFTAVFLVRSASAQLAMVSPVEL